MGSLRERKHNTISGLNKSNSGNLYLKYNIFATNDIDL